MKNEKKIVNVLIGGIIFLVIIIIGGISYYIYDHSGQYIKSPQDKKRMLNIIRSIENKDEKTNLIQTLLDAQKITQKEANSLY